MDYKIVLDSCGELTYKMKESGIYHTAVLSMLEIRSWMMKVLTEKIF